MKGKAVVLLSGGQDSTTCLYWAKKMCPDGVEAIGFYYGQKHKQELEQAQKIAGAAGVNYKIFDLQGIFAGSSLVDHSQDVSAKHQINPELPSSFTAGRNMVFLSIAAGHAFNTGATNLITGVCETDFSGYPDCRKDFIDSMEETVNLALGLLDKDTPPTTHDKYIIIHTPLMDLSKAETWRLAKDLQCLDIIINDTLTDYNGDMTRNPWGYGVRNNPATELRARGYEEAVANGWI